MTSRDLVIRCLEAAINKARTQVNAGLRPRSDLDRGLAWLSALQGRPTC